MPSQAKPAASHKWEPIKLIDAHAEDYDFQEINSLQSQWLEIKREAEESTPDAYKEFTDRLTRSWAIETGIIEGIYDLDRGVTKTLVEKGISDIHIKSGSTDKDPAELVRILRDHQNAIGLVNEWIREGRHLSVSLIRMLHQAIAKNQHTYEAIDQFGRRFAPTLHKGEFKKQPNNPTRQDGSVHEYCPPEQVDSELETLIEFYKEYDADGGYHPLLVGAWLHHRFTQIHPFQDGNGRVGRAILTWHLVKNEFFPIVISRDDRVDYIDTLERADAGPLTPIIALFARLEKNTILQALSATEPESAVAPEPQLDLIKQVVGGIAQRVQRRRQSEAQQMRTVNTIAQALRGEAEIYLNGRTPLIQEELGRVGVDVDPRMMLGGSDQYNEHWYRAQVNETANRFGHWVNQSEPRYFVRLSLNAAVERAPRAPRLVFVISLHNIGRRLTGIMAATAFAEIHYNSEASDESEQTDGFSGGPDFKECAVNPFTFTSKDTAAAVTDRFKKWTEESFAVALRHWGEYLTP